MKKPDETKSFNIDTSSKKEFENNYIKTTNVNILLNRVRLDKKRDIKKKVLLSLSLITAIIALIAYLNI